LLVRAKGHDSLAYEVVDRAGDLVRKKSRRICADGAEVDNVPRIQRESADYFTNVDRDSRQEPE
jgi:hypothetical protein